MNYVAITILLFNKIPSWLIKKKTLFKGPSMSPTIEPFNTRLNEVRELILCHPLELETLNFDPAFS